MRERESERERERSNQAERELAVWWPCITHVRAALHVGLGVSSRSGELPLPSARCRGSIPSKNRNSEAETEREGARRRHNRSSFTAQAPGEESSTKERNGKRSPTRKHVSNTDAHALTGRKNPRTCSASSGCGETGELFLVL